MDRGADRLGAAGELEVVEAHVDSGLGAAGGVRAIADQDGAGVEVAVGDLFAVAVREGVGDLLDDGEPIIERELRVEAQEGSERLGVWEVFEDEARAGEGAVGDVVLHPQDVAVVPEDGEELGFTVGGALALVALGGAGRLRHEVEANAALEGLDVFVGGQAVFVAVAALDDLVDEVVAELEAALVLAEAELCHRFDGGAHHEAIDAAVLDALATREVRVGDRPAEGRARDDLGSSGAVEAAVGVGAGEEDQGDDPRGGRAHLAPEEAGQDFGLVVGGGQRVGEAGAPAVGPGVDPLAHARGGEGAGVALDLDEVEGVARQDEGVDLEHAAAGVDEVDERPEADRVAVGELVAEKDDGLLLPRVAGDPLSFDALVRERH